MNELNTASLLLHGQPAQEPVYWEYRFFDSHPDTVTSGQWSQWQRVLPRNGYTDTVEARVEEIKQYINQGYRYELRPLYTSAPKIIDSKLNKSELIKWTLDGDKKCGYNNWLGETPFGPILITWKGWKQHHDACVDHFPGGFIAYGSPDSVKEECEAEFYQRIQNLLKLS